MPTPPSMLLAPTAGFDTKEQLAHLLLGLHSRLHHIEELLLLPAASSSPGTRAPDPVLVDVALGLLAFRRTISATLASAMATPEDAAAPPPLADQPPAVSELLR
jgi:hypothetical protein